MARFSRYDKILGLLFVFSLPLVNPWVRGDGVGYYAFGRSLLIEHNLNFKKDWLAANESFRIGTTDPNGNLLPKEYTPTGHIDNHFSIGPAILWAPFLITAHLTVLLCDALGAHVSADGYSEPYVLAMAIATALYGFLAIWISFRLSRKYFSERCAFFSALGIWFASSLPVYMYFNPSWSHAHSAFMVALFVWYWHRTRENRRWAQWFVLGLIGGLMMDVYYPNGLLFLLPLLESLRDYWKVARTRALYPIRRLFLGNVLFIIAIIFSFLPTLLTKKAIYGGYLKFGYEHLWVWTSPAIVNVCFSAEHGLFSWTPILIAAVVGLFFLLRYDRPLALYSIVVFVSFLYVIGCYADWHGISSFGNRFFVSLTALFILGLAAFLDWVAHTWNERRARALIPIATAGLILWNLGLIFQWGTHLLPARGPISWREAAHNQVTVVPARMAGTLKNYFTRRGQLMNNIEQKDVQQQSHPAHSSQ